MRTTRWNLALGLGLLLAVVLACNFSATTANISSLKISKSKNASDETSTFGANDTVYAVAEISNVPGKVKVKAKVVADNIEGVNSGTTVSDEPSLDMPGSGTATFTFTPPPSGWPKGKYKIEVVMTDENGAQKDQKSGSFTIS